MAHFVSAKANMRLPNKVAFRSACADGRSETEVLRHMNYARAAWCASASPGAHESPNASTEAQESQSTRPSRAYDRPAALPSLRAGFPRRSSKGGLDDGGSDLLMRPIQPRRNREQNGAVEQIVAARTRALAVVPDKRLVARQIPGVAGR